MRQLTGDINTDDIATRHSTSCTLTIEHTLPICRLLATELPSDYGRTLVGCVFFFFNDPAPPELSPLPLHDALPICPAARPRRVGGGARAALRRRRPRAAAGTRRPGARAARFHARTHGGADRSHLPRGARRAFEREIDRKSTRLNSSHGYISYAVFCL